jgi:hypothetical protein
VSSEIYIAEAGAVMKKNVISLFKSLLMALFTVESVQKLNKITLNCTYSSEQSW